MKRNYFSVLFFIKKSKLLKNGEAPVCLRITVNGQRAEVQIKRSVDARKWNNKKECAVGKDRQSQVYIIIEKGSSFYLKSIPFRKDFQRT